MKGITLVCLLLTFYFGCRAQDFTSQLNKLTNVIPPSPDAASLGKYGEWPVGLYTGVPQISIPIYELKGRSISVPISVSYHASGIQVGEIASRVGLGWSLNAGGAITRSVRGLPDELTFAGYRELRKHYPNPVNLTDASSSGLPDSVYFQMICEGKWDIEPDQYYISILGRSYKFYYSANDSIITQPYSNVKIHHDVSNDQFIVFLEDGTRFVFGGTGFTELTNNGNLNSVVPSANNFISTWYLKTMTSVQNETISFAYSSPYEIDYKFNASAVDYRLDTNKAWIWASITGGMDIWEPILPFTSPSTHEKNTAVSHQAVVHRSISSITSELTQIIFNSETSEREDLADDYALESIVVKSMLDSVNLFKFKFYHSYSQSATPLSTQCAAGTNTGESLKRLKLNTIRQVNPSNDAKLNEWTFEYNSRILPTRGSFSQDHWGFYNGKNNETLLPPEPGFIMGDNVYGEGNREVDSVFTQAEMLNKITYPTGGFSTFTYENNSHKPLAVVYNAVTSTPLHKDLYYDPLETIHNIAKVINIPFVQNVKFNLHVNYTSAYLPHHTSPSLTIPIATLKSPSGAKIYQLDKSTGGFKSTDLYLDEVGDWELKLTWTNNSNDPVLADDDDSFIESTLTYTEDLGAQIVKKYIGGLRIQSIENNDGSGLKNTLKKFKYENPYVITPQDLSIDYLSSFTEHEAGWGPYPGDPAPHKTINKQFWIARSSSTKSALGSIQGGVVGYGKVTTTNEPKITSGKIVSIFSNYPDIGQDSARVFPFAPAQSRDNRRGLLLSESIYNSDGDLLRKDSTVYSFPGIDSVTTKKVGMNNYAPSLGTMHWSWIKSKPYTLVSEKVQKIRSIQTIYDDDGSNPLSSSTNYFYDNNQSCDVTRVESINSKGNTIKTIYRTPFDKSDINAASTLSTDASNAIDKMIAKNIINLKLQSEKYNGFDLINRSTSNYKIWNGTVEPDNVKLKIGSNDEEKRIELLNYDANGNLLEQRKANDISHSYLYGYSNNYPIAEIINAGNSEVAYTSFEAVDNKGNWSFSGMTRYSSPLPPTGKRCYNIALGAMSKTGLSSSKEYIISYWYSSGSAIALSTSSTGSTTRTGQNGWTYKQQKITGVSSVTISGTGLIDEVRLYPSDAQMSTYTYVPLFGIWSSSDSNGINTYNEYDEFGRLKAQRDDHGNIIKTYQYHYKGQ
ncbi:hypothetical protein BH09BAC3_BH09BAC3_35950 [soil metagenome]